MRSSAVEPEDDSGWLGVTAIRTARQPELRFRVRDLSTSLVCFHSLIYQGNSPLRLVLYPQVTHTHTHIVKLSLVLVYRYDPASWTTQGTQQSWGLPPKVPQRPGQPVSVRHSTTAKTLRTWSSTFPVLHISVLCLMVRSFPAVAPTAET